MTRGLLAFGVATLFIFESTTANDVTQAMELVKSKGLNDGTDIAKECYRIQGGNEDGYEDETDMNNGAEVLEFIEDNLTGEPPEKPHRKTFDNILGCYIQSLKYCVGEGLNFAKQQAHMKVIDAVLNKCKAHTVMSKMLTNILKRGSCTVREFKQHLPANKSMPCRPSDLKEADNFNVVPDYSALQKTLSHMQHTDKHKQILQLALQTANGLKECLQKQVEDKCNKGLGECSKTLNKPSDNIDPMQDLEFNINKIASTSAAKLAKTKRGMKKLYAITKAYCYATNTFPSKDDPKDDDREPKPNPYNQCMVELGIWCGTEALKEYCQGNPEDCKLQGA